MLWNPVTQVTIKLKGSDTHLEVGVSIDVSSCYGRNTSNSGNISVGIWEEEEVDRYSSLHTLLGCLLIEVALRI